MGRDKAKKGFMLNFDQKVSVLVFVCGGLWVDSR